MLECLPRNDGYLARMINGFCGLQLCVLPITFEDDHSSHFELMLLVFSKCFRAGFYIFSRLKFKVNKGTNSCNLSFEIKTKTYLVFISMVTIHSACHR